MKKLQDFLNTNLKNFIKLKILKAFYLILEHLYINIFYRNSLKQGKFLFYKLKGFFLIFSIKIKLI